MNGSDSDAMLNLDSNVVIISDSDSMCDMDKEPMCDMDDDMTSISDQGEALVVKSILSQFYNLISHRTATCAGRNDVQQGKITAAIAGYFTQSVKDNRTAEEVQE